MAHQICASRVVRCSHDLSPSSVLIAARNEETIDNPHSRIAIRLWKCLTPVRFGTVNRVSKSVTIRE